MESVGNSLPEIITTVVDQWRSISKPRQRELLRICSRKYGDLERTHESFLAILNELHAVLMSVITRDRPVDTRLTDEIWAFEERRRLGRPARHAAYLEAQVYAEAEPTRFAGMIKKVPPPVEEAVKRFMTSYMKYFEYGGIYDHEAARAIRESVYALSDAVNSGGSESVSAELRQAVKFISTLRDSLDLSWITVSRNYFRLYSTFLDHGVILE